MATILRRSLYFLMCLLLIQLLSCSYSTTAYNDLSERLREQLMINLLSGHISPYPEVLVYPEDGDTSVSSYTDIAICFSEPLDQLGDWTVTVGSTVYTNSSPEVSWDALCIPDHCYPELIIHPAKPLVRGEAISVQAGGFQKESGKGSYDDITWSFTTEGGHMSISINPPGYSSSNETDCNVSLTFSEAVDTESAWVVNIDGINYDKFYSGITWNESNTVLTINPTGYFNRNSTVLVSATGFEASLDWYPFSSYQSRFYTIPGPGITISPKNGDTAIHQDAEIIITFSELPVHDDTWSVSAQGTVYNQSSPDILWEDDTTLSIKPAAEFPFLSTITVIANDFHAAMDYYPFPAPSQVSFKTGMYVESIPLTDSISYGTKFSSATDSQGSSYVGFYDFKTAYPVYMTNNGGSWQKYPVDTAQYLGNIIKLAVNSEDTLLALYPDYWGEQLTFAANDGGTWSGLVIDPTDHRGPGASLALDADDSAHASYWNWYPHYDLIYATNKSGVWVPEIVDPGLTTSENNSSIAVDLNGNIHICYCANDNLRYATNKSGSWEVTVIDAVRFTGYKSSIAIDSENAVHITYFDTSNSSNNKIKYATNKSGAWQLTSIDTVFHSWGDISISIDQSDNIYIGYIDWIQEEYKSFLKLARYKTGAWTMYRVDADERMGDNVTMSIDVGGFVHLFYECGLENEFLRHATNENL